MGRNNFRSKYSEIRHEKYRRAQFYGVASIVALSLTFNPPTSPDVENRESRDVDSIDSDLVKKLSVEEGDERDAFP